MQTNRLNLHYSLYFCNQPINNIIIHSKYFPDSDWLKAHI